MASHPHGRCGWKFPDVPARYCMENDKMIAKDLAAAYIGKNELPKSEDIPGIAKRLADLYISVRDDITLPTGNESFAPEGERKQRDWNKD
jgi:hypothetical protein